MDAADMGRTILDADETSGSASRAARTRVALDERELAFIKARRRFLEAAEAPAKAVPAELLEHGTMSLERAATFLGKSVADLVERTLYRREGERLPVLRGNRTPISEVCRAFKRRQDGLALELAREAAQCLNARGPALWDGHHGMACGIFWDARPSDLLGRNHMRHALHGFGLDGIAEQLGVSKAEAKRLMNGPLFTWVGRGGANSIVTPEELAAYKRKLARKAAHARQVTPAA